jgi:hypothetical protein
VVQKSNPQQLLQVFIIVIPVKAFLSFGLKEMVALFPDTQGMGLDAGKIFNIPDRKVLHDSAFSGYPL